jgi:hypothetical protein
MYFVIFILLLCKDTETLFTYFFGFYFIKYINIELIQMVILYYGGIKGTLRGNLFFFFYIKYNNNNNILI